MAVKSVANSLTSGPDIFASDDDPELVRDALPFGLKFMESLLSMVPDHEGLLLTCCRGYTQYAFAFVQADADAVEGTDRARAAELRERALKLYLRARGFGLRGLELRHRGIADEFRGNPTAAAARLTAKELPLIYWTAASWGSAISVAKDRPEISADIDAVRALMGRALQLDEDYEGGAVHEAMIVLEALPAMMGGSLARAREHFQRAVDLSKGSRAAPFVTLAENVAVQEQNRAEFERLLKQALEIDPERNPQARLETLLVQKRARTLLSREDDLFLEADTTQIKESR
jgi:predicted anti-sigma-YlaC factor YlaD